MNRYILLKVTLVCHTMVYPAFASLFVVPLTFVSTALVLRLLCRDIQQNLYLLYILILVFQKLKSCSLHLKGVRQMISLLKAILYRTLCYVLSECFYCSIKFLF